VPHLPRVTTLIATVVFPIAAIAAAYWLVAHPILVSPYWGDDIGDSQIPMYLARTHTPFLEWVINQTRVSSASTGRFFPLSIANGSAVYVLFEDRESYKLYQFAILALAVTSVGVFVGVILKSRWAGYLAASAAVLTIQFKAWFDPYWQFSGQQSTVAILTTTAFLLPVLACRVLKPSWQRWLIFGGLVVFAAAELMYEQSIFLLPILPFLLMRERVTASRRSLITGGYGLVALLLFGNLLWQRSHAVVTNSGYALSLHPLPVVKTLINQMTNALPLSYQWFTRHAVLPEAAAWPTSKPLTVVITLTFALAIAWIALHVMRLQRHGLWWFCAAATTWWVVPSIFVAISARWQLEVSPGRGYIPVLAGGFAVALLLTAATLGLGRVIASPAGLSFPWTRTRSPLLITALLLGLASGGVLAATASNNFSAVRYEPVRVLQAQRDAFAASVTNGLFDSIPDNAVIVRPLFNPWDWQNSDFAAWYGASPNLRFVRPEDLSTVNCGGADSCFRIIESSPTPGVITYKVVPY
jgi:hypothetical protein